MGMALAGGAADKLGNGYERRFTVLAMIEILMGRADSLRVEVPGDEGVGAEFRLRVGTTSRWTQSKRQRSIGSWTLSALLKENFLQQWLPKLRAGDICTFSSTTSADELRQLCAGALDAIDVAEFERDFLGSGRQKRFEVLKAAWGAIGSEEAWRLLRQIKVDTIDDDRLDQQIETSLYVLIAGNRRAARRLLLQYADEVLHKEVRADDIWEFLQDNGVDRAGQIVPSAAPAVSTPEARWLSDRLERLPGITHGRINAAMATDGRSARRLVRLLTEFQEPKAVLTEWASKRPAWLVASDWDTQLAAAELAGAYGVPQLEAALFMEVVQQGCPPEEVWTARAALALTAVGDTSERAGLLEALNAGISRHPYSRAVAAVFGSQPEDALRLVEAWHPEDRADQSAKAMLLIQIPLGHPDEDPSFDDVEQALAVADDVLADRWFGGIALWRARVLILRARRRGSKVLFADLRKAQETALRVRDDRRVWRSKSAEAVAVSCEAAGLRGDLDFVLRVGLPEELGGLASTAEFEDSNVAFQVAMAALRLLKFDIADRAATHVTSAFDRKLLEALGAQVRREDSSSLWREAVHLAANNHENLVQALNGLARTGTTDLPRLDDLRQISEQAAAEVRATAEIKAGNFGRSIATLRVQRRGSLSAAITLADAYGSTGQVDSAAETLLDAADDFNDPELRFQAAVFLAGKGQAERAKGIVAALIRDRDHDWPESVDVLKFAAQLALDEPDLDLAIIYCRRILQEDPRDDSTRWVLINSLMILDRMNDAWEVFGASPLPLHPENRTQAQMWVELHRRFAGTAATIRGCIEILRRFRDDEELSAFALYAVMEPRQGDDPVPAELLGEYHKELERFFDRWPASPRLRRIRTDDDELLIQAITDELRPTPERLAEHNRLNRQFQRAEKPLVLLAEYVGKTYFEVLLRRGFGVLPVVHPDPQESALCRATIRHSADHDVAIDASAIVVLSVLPPAVRDAALAVFRRGLTTDEVARDARQYGEDLDRGSGHLYYNAAADAPGFTEFTEEEKAVIRAGLASVQGLISGLQRQPIQPGAPGRRARISVHASVVQLSASKRIAVWCDDSAARLGMRSIGVASFSTVAVLEHLLSDGVLSSSEFDAAMDTFVRERIGTAQADLTRIARVARQQAWLPDGAAACLAQPHAWADIADTSAIANDLLRLCLRENPDQVPAWLYAAVFGAVMNCPNTRAGVEIGALLLAGNLLALTASGRLAREMVAATRSAVAAALPVDNPAGVTTDPLPAAAGHMVSLLLPNSAVRADEVFPLILQCLAELDDQDVRLVAEAILAESR
ncbi:tetratricopeptide repeat protein [Actinoplanes sp. CA-252034]|uniref:tetratricopeptide repeat protein n=1 Tax=Actinoplanes sp. CA-252034 TaxID=3239906 RepID=UPI003D951C0C